jgi:hypothetical protein
VSNCSSSGMTNSGLSTKKQSAETVDSVRIYRSFRRVNLSPPVTLQAMLSHMDGGKREREKVKVMMSAIGFFFYALQEIIRVVLFILR